MRPSGSIVMSILLVLSACSGLPSESRTGRTAIVKITDDEVVPRDITVQTGDEVRLLNDRDSPIWIYFSRENPRELSCQRGFSYYWGVEEVAKINPSEFAGLCFAQPGEYGYWVQSKPTDRGGARLGEMNMPAALPAVIIVDDVRRSSTNP